VFVERQAAPVIAAGQHRIGHLHEGARAGLFGRGGRRSFGEPVHGGRQIAQHVADGSEIECDLVILRSPRECRFEPHPRLGLAPHAVKDAAEIFERVGVLGRAVDGLAGADQRPVEIAGDVAAPGRPERATQGAIDEYATARWRKRSARCLASRSRHW